MWVTKLLFSPVKKKDFLPKNDKIWPEIGIFGQFGPGHAGLFGALLVGRLVVVVRGLYLARHLITLYIIIYIVYIGLQNQLTIQHWLSLLQASTRSGWKRKNLKLI